MNPELLIEETKCEIRRLMSNMATLATRTEDPKEHMTYSYVTSELKTLLDKLREPKPVQS